VSVGGPDRAGYYCKVTNDKVSFKKKIIDQGICPNNYYKPKEKTDAKTR
jgi:hypothetical protein